MRNGQASRYLEAAAKRRKFKPSPIGDETANTEDTGQPSSAPKQGSKGAKPVGERWHPEEREHHRQERTYWRFSAVLTAVAAAGAIATVILSQCSLNEARLATAESHRQADAAEKTLISSNRAVIITGGIEWQTPIERDKDNAVNVIYYNIGKDSVNVHAVREIAFGLASKNFLENDSAFPKSDSCNIKNYSVGNLATLPATNGIPFYTIGIPIPSKIVNGIIDGQFAISVQGCLFYEDFGKIFWTPYCYVAAQKGSVASAKTGAVPLCANADTLPR